MSLFGNNSIFDFGKGGGLDRLDNFLFGNGEVKANVPADMAPLRAQMLKLLQSFMQPGSFQGGTGSDFFFGPGGGAANNLLKQTSPEMQAFNTARPVLEGMLTGTGPQFERDISMANSQGGRFGSANAIMRGEALRHLFNARTQTASTLGGLAGQAGTAQWDRAFASQSQILQLLAGLMGMSGQATLSLPVEKNKGAFGDIVKAGAAVFG